MGFRLHIILTRDGVTTKYLGWFPRVNKVTQYVIQREVARETHTLLTDELPGGVYILYDKDTEQVYKYNPYENDFPEWVGV